jgi:hypothetical protein
MSHHMGPKCSWFSILREDQVLQQDESYRGIESYSICIGELSRFCPLCERKTPEIRLAQVESDRSSSWWPAVKHRASLSTGFIQFDGIATMILPFAWINATSS